MKTDCDHTGKVIQKMGGVICAQCRVILYYGLVREEDKKRLIK
jgi:hypothetical protein